MKITWIYLLMFVSVVNAQKLKHVDTLKYDYVVSKQYNSSFRNGMDISNYITFNENLVNEGDTLIIGKPFGINTQSTGIGVDTSFEYLFYGKPAGTLLKGIRYVEGTYSGYELVVDKIQYNKGSMGLENYVFVYGIPHDNKNFTIIDDVITVTEFDKAIERGEIVLKNENRPMTREDALEILRKKKEELDLQLITQDDYDKIKTKLLPIINQD